MMFSPVTWGRRLGRVVAALVGVVYPLGVALGLHHLCPGRYHLPEVGLIASLVLVHRLADGVALRPLSALVLLDTHRLRASPDDGLALPGGLTWRQRDRVRLFLTEVFSRTLLSAVMSFVWFLLSGWASVAAFVAFLPFHTYITWRRFRDAPFLYDRWLAQHQDTP